MPKKNALFWTIGPPTLAAELLVLELGDRPIVGAVADPVLVAAEVERRPRTAFEPLLVMALIPPPAKPP